LTVSEQKSFSLYHHTQRMSLYVGTIAREISKEVLPKAGTFIAHETARVVMTFTGEKIVDLAKWAFEFFTKNKLMLADSRIVFDEESFRIAVFDGMKMLMT